MLLHVHGEEHLFKESGLDKVGSDNYVQAGELAGESVKFRMVFLAGEFFGKSIPEAAELLLRHVEDVLYLLHRRIDFTNLKQVADVEHRVAVCKAVKVNPVI